MVHTRADLQEILILLRVATIQREQVGEIRLDGHVPRPAGVLAYPIQPELVDPDLPGRPRRGRGVAENGESKGDPAHPGEGEVPNHRVARVDVSGSHRVDLHTI